jgi:hypothetical protein
MLPTKADDVSQLEPFQRRLILLAILLLLPVLQAGAQQTGAIRGRVLDQSGAVMPGVPVTITSTDGARQIAKTGPGGMFGSSSSSYRYSLTLSVSAQNLLNHTNAGNPVTSLSSPLFGQSLSSAGGFGMGPGGGGPGGPGGGGAAGNRKIELQLRFSF